MEPTNNKTPILPPQVKTSENEQKNVSSIVAQISKLSLSKTIKNYSCALCSKCFQRDRELMNHVSAQHINVTDADKPITRRSNRSSSNARALSFSNIAIETVSLRSNLKMFKKQTVRPHETNRQSGKLNLRMNITSNQTRDVAPVSESNANVNALNNDSPHRLCVFCIMGMILQNAPKRAIYEKILNDCKNGNHLHTLDSDDISSFQNQQPIAANIIQEPSEMIIQEAKTIANEQMMDTVCQNVKDMQISNDIPSYPDDIE